jgi:hypothetical protein
VYCTVQLVFIVRGDLLGFLLGFLGCVCVCSTRNWGAGWMG